MREVLKKKKSDYAQAVSDARTIANNMSEQPERRAELEEQWTRAFSTVESLKKEIQNLEARVAQLDALEAHARDFEPNDDALRVGGEGKEKSGRRDDSWKDTLRMRERSSVTINSELHRELLGMYLTQGPQALSRAVHALETAGDITRMERNALMVVDDTVGGFTVPEDFRTEILKAVAGFSVVRRAGARSITTNRTQVTFPTVNPGTNPYSSDLTAGNSDASSNWKPEGKFTGGTAPDQQNKPTFGREIIPVHIWQPDVVEITPELLEDTAIALEGLLADLFAEVRALDEDWAFLLGNGVGKPEGILNSGATTVNFGDQSSDLLIYSDVVNTFVGLPAQYRGNASWIFNSNTFGKILKMDGNNGTGRDERPLFNVNELFQNLLGRPFYVSEFMPSVASAVGAKACIFGDMRHFVIVERRDMRIQRLVERFAPNIGLLPTARIGGQVTVRDAFRIGVSVA